MYPCSDEAKKHGCTCVIDQNSPETFYVHRNCQLHEWIYEMVPKPKKRKMSKKQVIMISGGNKKIH
jgi:hypothetical protein